MDNYPKVSVITPSFNQAAYLECTIRSVLDQGYPNLEYIIIDGGSTDGSVDIIKKYEDGLAYWVSEPDGGQVHAINKGLKMATGEWEGWQNSDDIYYPGAFDDLARAGKEHPEADLIIGNIMLIDENDKELRDIHYVRPTYWSLLAEGMLLPNQAAFWRRSVHEDIGWLDEEYKYSFDYEWFLRLLHRRTAFHVNKILGGFRLHEEAKTSNFSEYFWKENESILSGKAIPWWLAPASKIRRLALYPLQGDFSYVVRGLSRRMSGRGGDLF